MDQENNERLLSDLLEAKGSFDILINKMKDDKIEYPYDSIIFLVETDYHNIYYLINELTIMTDEYSKIKERNKDLIRRNKEIKYLRILTILVLLYIMGLYNKKMVDRVLSLISIMFFIIVSDVMIDNIDSYNFDLYYHNKKVELRLSELEREYKEKYQFVNNEIDYLCSLNRNLWEEWDKNKLLIKK